MPTQTQFALIPVGRLIHLVSHYGALRVDAIYLPPDPFRPPLNYIDRTLCELRTELRLREEAVAPAAVLS